MTTECTLYTFTADAPNGVIQVARLTTQQKTAEYAYDLLIGFPERFMQSEPRCLKLQSMSGVILVDEQIAVAR